MKKFFTLTLAAAFAIGTAVAAIPTNKAELSFMKRDMNKGEIAAAFPTLKADKRTQEIMSKGLSMSQFSRSSEDIIWNVDAEDVTYSLQTEGFYISGLFAFYGYNSGRGMIAEDGDQVYFKNPMMSQPTGAYVVGERSGNKITAKFPQHVDDYDYNGSIISYYVGKMKQVVDDEGYISYYPVADEENEITWDIMADGSIVLDLDKARTDADGNPVYPEYIYGCGTTSPATRISHGQPQATASSATRCLTVSLLKLPLMQFGRMTGRWLQLKATLAISTSQSLMTLYISRILMTGVPMQW